ncbi:hypothetical protein PROVRETT_06708 [Providencia rettgeri DSM 1131]|nr:hypothetical protein PROVRETT_06708 [Providencia rettgeri DSM 1131]
MGYKLPIKTPYYPSLIFFLSLFDINITFLLTQNIYINVRIVMAVGQWETIVG